MGSLKSLTVQPATKKRYTEAVDQFLLFLKDNLLQLPRERAKLDGLVCEYLEHLWATGEGRARASDTIAGLQDMDPQLKRCFVSTWRLMKVWNTHEVPNRAPPLPESILRALAGYALFHDQDMFALTLLLGYYGMMRTGELLGLRKHQVDVKGPDGPAVISLGLTKTGKRQGAAESITITVHDVVRRLWQWKQTNIVTLVPSASKWRSDFSSACEALGLKDLQFRPYSLRRGGATFWIGKHGSLDRLLIQGRWQAARTARIYINEGLSVLAEMKFSSRQMHAFQKIYTRALDTHLPQLERTRKASSSGGRGKGRKKPKNPDI